MEIVETRYFQIWINFGGMADKHHNTVKFLIGITPQWTVSFLSEA